MRVWFNKTFSSIHSALHLISEADKEGRYELLVSSSNSHSLARLHAHRFFEEPSEFGASYVDWCEAFCKEHGIDIFIPGKEATRIAGEHERFANVGAMVMSGSSLERLRVINDKGVFYETVNCIEAPSPTWLSFNNLDGFDRAYNTLSCDYESLCIKPAVSVYGIGFRRIRENRSAFKIFAKGDTYQIDLPALRTMLGDQKDFPSLLLMEYLDGHEFSVDCIADKGVLKCAIARCKSLVAGGGQIIDPREDIQTACKCVVAQFKLNGFANIQFREGRDGLRILEVNPRMSGGIAMACLAGPNLPFLGLAGFDVGYDNITIPSIAVGLRVGEYNQASVLPWQ